VLPADSVAALELPLLVRLVPVALVTKLLPEWLPLTVPDSVVTPTESMDAVGTVLSVPEAAGVGMTVCVEIIVTSATVEVESLVPPSDKPVTWARGLPLPIASNVYPEPVPPIVPAGRVKVPVYVTIPLPSVTSEPESELLSLRSNTEGSV